MKLSKFLTEKFGFHYTDKRKDSYRIKFLTNKISTRIKNQLLSIDGVLSVQVETLKDIYLSDRLNKAITSEYLIIRTATKPSLINF